MVATAVIKLQPPYSSDLKIHYYHWKK